MMNERMSEQIYVMLHHSADRVALEAARKELSNQKEEDRYIISYAEVMDYLITSYLANAYRIDD